MHPLLATFIKVTLIVAVAAVAVILLLVVLKVVLFAAIVAGLAIGVLFLVNLFRKPRLRLPVAR